MSRDMVYEKVPSVSRRAGDHVIAGQNNSTIILGRDRNGPVDSGYGSRSGPGGGSGAGAIHLTVGRGSEDPSVKDDSATLYLSAKTDPDDQAGTTSVGSRQDGRSAVVMRADCMRITARADMKLSVGRAYITLSSDGKIVLEGDIDLGLGAFSRLIRGDVFAPIWAAHTHPVVGSNTGPPQQPLLDPVFTTRVRVG